MASLLSAATANGAGTGVAMTGPCTVIVENDSVFDRAEVHIEVSETDTAGKYAPAGREAILRAAGAIRIDVTGAYYVRARIAKAESATSINAVAIQ